MYRTQYPLIIKAITEEGATLDEWPLCSQSTYHKAKLDSDNLVP